MAGASDAAVRKALTVVGEQADREVPHDTGALSRTRVIKVEHGSGVISYGGGKGTGFTKIPYAVRWHEEDANFQKGRKKNYLRDPFNKLAARKYKQALRQEGRSRL